MPEPLRLGVLISGGGTTLLNLDESIHRGDLDALVVTVIAGQARCEGITRAALAGLSTEIVPRSSYRTLEEFSEEVFTRLRAAGVDLVILAGFLSLLEIPDDYTGRVMNIHPSLIPAFCGHGYYGHKVHEAAIDRGVKVSGCTVHFADNQYDHGPIILQRTVSIPDGTTPEELGQLVFEEEKKAYPAAIRLFAEGRLEVRGRHVLIRPA